MKKANYIVCSKYRKIEKTEIPYIFEITLDLSFVCSKCKNKKYIFFEKDSIKILKFYVQFKNYNYF